MGFHPPYQSYPWIKQPPSYLILPQEIAEKIVYWLPIDQHLQSVGFVCKSLGKCIFFNIFNANRHFARFEYRIQRSVFSIRGLWSSLPFPYKSAAYNWCWDTAESDYSYWDRRWVECFSLPISQSIGLKLHQCYVRQSSNHQPIYTTNYVRVATTSGLLQVLEHVFSETAFSLFDFEVPKCIPSFITTALQKGHFEVADFLFSLKDFDPSVNHGVILKVACEYNLGSIVKRILVDPRMEACIAEASRQALGQVVSEGMVKLVLSDKRVCSSELASNSIFASAIGQKNEGIIQLSIKMKGFDPSVDNCAAFKAACRFGNTRLVDIWLKDKRVNPAVADIDSVVSNGHLGVLRLLLEDGRANPIGPWQDDIVLRACQCNNSGAVRLLLKDGRANPSSSSNAAIIHACQRPINRTTFCGCPPKQHCNHIVQHLLSDPRVDPSVNGNQPLRDACRDVLMETVDALLLDTRVNPDQETWESMTNLAAEKGHSNLLKRFLQHPWYDPRLVICEANVEWFLEVADILLEHSRLDFLDKVLVSELKQVSISFFERIKTVASEYDIPWEAREYNEKLGNILKASYHFQLHSQSYK
ncbi:UNVERIFIED_CONTAM: hypothetical protein HDU68_010516 [Siphonaria sp. JEL0065]|nr:hypothetical protein HDU68_010516 [Siphonaria sp. JEL0065]